MKRSDVIHHICGLSLSGAAVYFFPIPEWYGRLLLVEISTIFFHSAWLMREANVSTRVITLLEYTFATCFFALRIILLPYYFFVLVKENALQSVGITFVCAFIVVILLQFYWFTFILDKVLKPRKKTEKKTKTV